MGVGLKILRLVCPAKNTEIGVAGEKILRLECRAKKTETD